MNNPRSLVSAYLLRLLHVLIVLGMAFASGTSRVLAQEANPPAMPSAPTAPVGYEAIVEPSADVATGAPEATPIANDQTDSAAAVSEEVEGEAGDAENVVEEQPAPSVIVPQSEQAPTQNTGMT
ncbi:MAG: hypothetical protein HC853_03605 [Anaerolineae bacterium]|nr:hypothetical protein [Anaerolineae bacterium]